MKIIFPLLVFLIFSGCYNTTQPIKTINTTMPKGKFVKIKYIMQLPTPQPQFAFFCNLPQYVKEPYKRFLENKLRALYDFKGVPITVYMRKK